MSKPIQEEDIAERTRDEEEIEETGVAEGDVSIPPKQSLKFMSKKRWPCKETDTFWHSAQNTPPPPSFTPGLVPLLQKALAQLHTRGLVRKAVLCSEKAVHSCREPWDASWGCGYRNFMMACAALMVQDLQPMYYPILDSPYPPSIRNLQRWIEEAWKEGFDLEGKEQLKNLSNTKKWIGTADLWVAFTFRGIPAKLVDFELDGNPARLLEWFRNYFGVDSDPSPANFFSSQRPSPIKVTEKMPVILQHKGHSRTIVGYEVDKNGDTHLLTFDPANRLPQNVRQRALAIFNEATQVKTTATISPTNTAEPEELQDADRGLSTSLKRKRAEDETNTQQPGKILGAVKNQKPNTSQEQDPVALLKHFRIPGKALKHKQYQVLYFPMSAPLLNKERLERKQVMSTKIRA